MRRAFLFVGLIAIAIIGWYFLSPLWTKQEIEARPLLPAQQRNAGGVEKLSPEKRDALAQDEAQRRKIIFIAAERVPPGAQVLSKTSLVPRAHAVEGNAALLEVNGRKMVRFESFQTVNGPKLHVYLATDLDATGFVDLGPLRATQGEMNYVIPDSVNLTTHRTVLIWSASYNVVFSSASL